MDTRDTLYLIVSSLFVVSVFLEKVFKVSL
jgi:hypothetical protein